MKLPSSYDVVGDILVFAEFPKMSETKERKIAEQLLRLHKNLKVICKKTRNYGGMYRLPRLKILAGDRRKETLHKENGCRLKLHVENVYFSPRLGTERQRINQLVKKNESVLVMFSGCGVYPINIARNTKAKEIYGIEINPVAHRYAEENLRLNKSGNITLLGGDVRKIIPHLHKKFDRIIMPLPKSAETFLDLAVPKIKKKGIIHLYLFIREENINNNYLENFLRPYLPRSTIKSVVKCGQFGPGKCRICVDIQIF